MIDIKEVLRRWSARQSLHHIARDTGVDRKTVRRYIHAAQSCSLPQDRELTEGEIHEVAQRVQARPLPDPSAEWQAVEAHKDRIEAWLTKKRPLRLTKVHTLLARDGLEVSYDTLRRFAMQQLGWRQQAPTVRVDDPPPGQEAQVDFGKMGPMLDPDTGRVRSLWALIITLSFSRYQFVWPSFLQTTETVCEGLDRAWAFFAAMIRTIVPDNMSAIVKTPDARDEWGLSCRVTTPVGVGAALSQTTAGRIVHHVGSRADFLFFAGVASAASGILYFFVPETRKAELWSQRHDHGDPSVYLERLHDVRLVRAPQVRARMATLEGDRGLVGDCAVRILPGRACQSPRQCPLLGLPAQDHPRG
jgi:transposase